MRNFRLTRLVGMALLAVVVAAGTAKATKADPFVSIGAQGFAEVGTPTADGSSSGNIKTATAFTVAALTSTTGQQGVFIGMPTQTFGFPFTLASLAFGNGVFGHFASTSISTATNVPGVVGIDVTGAWSPGSFSGFSGLGHGPFLSLLTLSFTQNPDTPPFGPISLSATFSTSETVIPEPPSIVLVLTGLAVGIGIYGLRRRRYLVTA